MMESGLHKQCQNLQASYDFVEVVFAWSSFTFANTLFKLNVLVLYILCYRTESPKGVLVTLRNNVTCYQYVNLPS